MSRAEDLLAELVKTAYPEPESALHRGVIDRIWADVIAPRLTMTPNPDGERSMLDIGAGDGYFIEKVSKLGIEAVGVNFLQEDVEKCRSRGLRCLPSDMHDLWLVEPNTYDIVTMRHVLEHSPFPMLALSEAHRVLALGGLLYVEVPACDTQNRHGENRNHWSLFPQSFWQQLIMRSSFDVIVSKELHFSTLAGRDTYYLWLCMKK